MRAPFKQCGPVLTETGRIVVCGALVIIIALISAFASINPSAAPERVERTETEQ